MEKEGESTSPESAAGAGPAPAPVPVPPPPAAGAQAAGDEPEAVTEKRLVQTGSRLLESIWAIKWRKGSFWVALVLLGWSLYYFLPIFVLTFVLSYIGNTVVEWLMRTNTFVEHLTGRSGKPSRMLATFLVYISFIAVMVGFGALTFPAVYGQGERVVDQIREITPERMETWLRPWIGAEYARRVKQAIEPTRTSAEARAEAIMAEIEGLPPEERTAHLAAALRQWEAVAGPPEERARAILAEVDAAGSPRERVDRLAIALRTLEAQELLLEVDALESPDDRRMRLAEYLEASEGESQQEIFAWLTGTGVETVADLLKIVATGLLKGALLFIVSFILSLLIVLQLHKLGGQIDTLAESRIGEFYREVAPGVRAFGGMMGKMLQAQSIVAVCNTFLTALGLWILGIDGVLFLSTIVFVCSFIPVMGVFISSIPMCLAALSQHGVISVLLVIAMVVIIHFIEAYFLNPQIYGHHMEMHPLAVIVILLVAEHFMGILGFILGVPVAVYIYQYVIRGQAWEGKETAAHQTAPPAPPAAS